MQTKRIYLQKHKPLNFTFTQNRNDFIVTEVPLYEFSGDGEHIVLKIRKKELA